MKIITLLVVVSFVLISGCSGSQEANQPHHKIPEPESAGGKVFSQFCGNCHAPPRIKSHKADEWKNVIERMQTHRLKKAYHLLSDEEKHTLLIYLQKHST